MERDILSLHFGCFQNQEPLQFGNLDVPYLGNLKNLFSNLPLKVSGHPGDKLL